MSISNFPNSPHNLEDTILSWYTEPVNTPDPLSSKYLGLLNLVRKYWKLDGYVVFISSPKFTISCRYLFLVLIGNAEINRDIGFSNIENRIIMT